MTFLPGIQGDFMATKKTTKKKIGPMEKKLKDHMKALEETPYGRHYKNTRAKPPKKK
jgi:hypothetical protein